MGIPKTLPGDGVEWRKYLAGDMADELQSYLAALRSCARYDGTSKEAVYILHSIQAGLRAAANEMAEIRDQISKDYCGKKATLADLDD